MNLLFYATDGSLAKARAALRRAEQRPTRAAECYACREPEPCDGIEFTDDVPNTERSRISALFGLETYPVALKRKASDPFDHDEDGKPGGRLSKAEIVHDLLRRGIDHDPAWPWTKLNAALREAKSSMGG